MKHTQFYPEKVKSNKLSGLVSDNNLTKASETELGVVSVDGSTITVSDEGVLSASGQRPIVVTLTAGETLSGDVCVTLNSEAAYYPTSAVIDGTSLLGITKGAAAAGASVDVVVSGRIVNTSWSWAQGPIYCTTSGVLTQTPPISGWCRRVALAISATELFVGLGELIVLGE